MKSLTFFTVSILIGLTCTAPTENSDIRTITESDFPEKYVIYRGEYDIANILFPITSLNAKEENSDSATGSSGQPIIFFALADYKNGKKEDKGFYIRKNGEVTKLLEHGRDAASAIDLTSEVYIAAEDGLYTYNPQNNKAEKYGTVTDDLIGIAKVNGSDIIYILTKDHEVYKVTEQGTKKDKVIEIVNPEQIVLDNENNLYYVANNNVTVVDVNGTRRIEGLPEITTYVKLIRPPYILSTGIPLVLDNDVYIAYANGTSARMIFNVTMRPTAYSVDAALLMYIGHDKKIYEFNLIAMIFDGIFSKFREYIDGLINSLKDKFNIFKMV